MLYDILLSPKNKLQYGSTMYCWFDRIYHLFKVRGEKWVGLKENWLKSQYFFCQISESRIEIVSTLARNELKMELEFKWNGIKKYNLYVIQQRYVAIFRWKQPWHLISYICIVTIKYNQPFKARHLCICSIFMGIFLIFISLDLEKSLKTCKRILLILPMTSIASKNPVKKDKNFFLPKLPMPLFHPLVITF